MVALANLSDAFNRMMSEPKNQQSGIEHIHRFVVLYHMFISHVATLAYYHQANPTYPFEATSLATQKIVEHLKNAIALLSGEPAKENVGLQESLRLVNEQADTLLARRHEELKKGMLETATKHELREKKSVADQYNFISNIVIDIQRSAKLIAAHLDS